MTDSPVVGITMGDAAGIGPEIIAKALRSSEVTKACRPVVIGDRSRLELAAEICRCPLEFTTIDSPDQAPGAAGTIGIIGAHPVPADLRFGEVSRAAGEAAYRYVCHGAELATTGMIQAICTAPLNKEALHAAGHPYPGHTELLAELTGVPEVSMMLSTGTINVIHVTTHIGLIDAIERIDSGLVYRTIQRGHGALARVGTRKPTIAVCGINPHAGENALFGRGEEEKKIVPAVEQARAEGIDAIGPLAADTVFFRAGRGDFDLVVAMYHDQGHGPVKILGLEAGVNITVGLPVIRTSVDHGTAFDIAGTGVADERSMIAAIRQAAAFAPAREGGETSPTSDQGGRQ
ncbi:MAG: 4-hydroxythreonine-4-phosphate dehydrogenase PdxA [Nocardioidaceae bacterium]